ncbi:MAG: HAD family hydrolase [Nitrosarchaeum sp.]
MIKGIIFDLDGTLIQLPVNYDVVQNNLKKFFNVEENLKPLIPTIIQLSKNDQNKINTAFELICQEEISAIKNFKIMNDAVEVLKFLKSKNLILCLVTMQCRTVLEQILQKMDISNLFDSVISRDENHDRFEQIQNSLNNLSLEPSKVLVVGDRIHDVESARKAGCTPILKINQIKKIPSFDCKLIENLNELKEII